MPKRTAPTLVHPDAAGVDIGAAEIFCAVPADRDALPVRRFSSFTPDLHALVHWCQKCGVRTVAMESTSVYWIPLYDLLVAAGLEVYLVNARHVKNVPGRKSDVADCQCLQQLHSFGLLRASFRPGPELCALRVLIRQRDTHLRGAARQVQHMQKALKQMNLQLSEVLTDITGLTGLTIIEAILAGERDPAVLASHRHYHVKASEATIRKALTGHYLPEHLFTLKQALALYRFYQELILQSDQQIEARWQALAAHVSVERAPLPPSAKKNRGRRMGNDPHFDVRGLIYRIVGVDLTQIEGIGPSVLQGFMAEVGWDMSRWKSAKHFASWLGVCPYNKITGGRVLARGTKRTTSAAKHLLRLAAQSLKHSKSLLGEQFRRLRARLGAPMAVTAMAHKLARMIYALLSRGQNYEPQRLEQQQQRHQQRQVRQLKKRAAALGFQLQPLMLPSNSF
jgi:transposase